MSRHHQPSTAQRPTRNYQVFGDLNALLPSNLQLASDRIDERVVPKTITYIQRLRVKIEDLRADIKDYKSEIKGHKSEIEALGETGDAIDEHLKQCHEQNRVLKEERERLLDESRDQERLIQQLRNDNRAQQANIQQLQRQIQNLHPGSQFAGASTPRRMH